MGRKHTKKHTHPLDVAWVVYLYRIRVKYYCCVYGFGRRTVCLGREGPVALPGEDQCMHRHPGVRTGDIFVTGVENGSSGLVRKKSAHKPAGTPNCPGCFPSVEWCSRQSNAMPHAKKLRTIFTARYRPARASWELLGRQPISAGRMLSDLGKAPRGRASLGVFEKGKPRTTSARALKASCKNCLDTYIVNMVWGPGLESRRIIRACGLEEICRAK